MPQTFYTNEEYESLKSKCDVAIESLNQLERMAQEMSQPDNAHGTREDGSYVFIPLTEWAFIDTLFEVKSMFGNKRVKFLDVGSGLGIKVEIAHSIGFDAYGIEIDTELVTKSIAYSRITQADALKHEHYSSFDVIYYYCPISNSNERLLEKAIEDGMKVGAILVPFLKRDSNIEEDARFKPIKLHHTTIYKKIKK